MDKEESCLLVRKASSYFYKMFFSSKEKSENSDSGLFVDEPWTFSRSSSQHSVCSCMACSTQGEWKRRPSRLLEGYDVEDFYKFDAVLGEGSFSTVYLAECRAEKGGWVAIKVVEKCNLLKTKKIPNPYESPKKSEDEEDEDDFVSRSMMEQNSREIMRLVDKEIRIMSALDHPHIIHLEEVFEDENRVCFVMELAQGGEVFDRLVEKVAFDEMQAADLIVQLLNAVNYIHSQGIVHRDLKLENLLYYDDTEDSKIMVADFGLSDWIKDLEDGLSPICGTPGYMAPEVVTRQSCTSKADVWAIGVISYILLAGYPPFYVQEASSSKNENEGALLRKIANGEYEFLSETWSDISPQAIDFIQKLMCKNPDERLTCQEALSHPWLNDRTNLEQRAANRKRKTSMLLDSSFWTWGQQVAFAFSVLVILGSYSALINYLFNVAVVKPSAIVHSLKVEFVQLYDNVYPYVDNYFETACMFFNKVVNILFSFYT